MEAEAGGEGDAGKLAVANVVRNRADSNYSGYGKDITSQVRAPLQFSAFNKYGSVNATGKRTMAMDPNGETMRHNYELADRVLARMEPDPTHGANQYYAPQGMPHHKAPKWWNNDYKTAEIGHQKFQSNPNSPVTVDQGRPMPGDQQMLASLGKTQDAGTTPMQTMLAEKSAPPAQAAPAPVAVAANVLPPEANSNQRYMEMKNLAPPSGDNPYKDLARNTAPAPNRVAALDNVRPDAPGIPSGDYLASRYGRDPAIVEPPGMMNPAQPNIADTPTLQNQMQAGGMGPMAMMAQPELQGIPMMSSMPEEVALSDSMPDMSTFDFGSMFG
jgi:hypothetical protein